MDRTLINNHFSNQKIPQVKPSYGSLLAEALKVFSKDFVSLKLGLF